MNTTQQRMSPELVTQFNLIQKFCHKAKLNGADHELRKTGLIVIRDALFKLGDLEYQILTEIEQSKEATAVLEIPEKTEKK